ncbi:DUF6879 family protein [Streptomonospora nanhaiensis]|uniref:DUF6879 family protein n=1 Tax=Streptomonospora nanhaiensis TaxID=1323731 RepID=UPI001C392FE1|nr:DUF6879 family protein [Streptomonospora nanhaiensis]MBV2363433.1 hypothetical protein [Streptomonospora nanhaiensis]MBX9387667.1 hypothetical protein [Streptomonospora nanhaiensis]
MLDAIRGAEGRTMDRPAYHADAAALRANPDITGDVWKLERSQVFYEAGDPAWEAFLAGDWHRALEIFESERPALHTRIETYTRQGLRLRRLRIVEHPLTPYLRWEMQSHRIFVECGYEIGVLEAEAVRDHERRSPLPELMVYGRQVIYQVRYDDRWAPAGAKRIDDPVLANWAADFISGLYARSQPFSEFFHREVGTAAPPSPVGD